MNDEEMWWCVSVWNDQWQSKKDVTVMNEEEIVKCGNDVMKKWW